MIRHFGLLILFSLSTAAFADERMSRSVQGLTKFLNNPSVTAECDPGNKCPEVVRESYEDMYRKGTVGFINTVVSDGSLKNPRTVCSSSAQYVQKMDMRKLHQQMNKTFPKSVKLYEYTQDCDELRPKLKEDKGLQEAYVLYDFHYKNEAIKTALQNLLESEAQINLISPGELSNCGEMRIAEVRTQCQELRGCKRERSAGQYLEMKSFEVEEAIKNIKLLEAEKRKLKRDKVKQIEQDIETIKELNPLLRGEKFKSLVSGKTGLSRAVINQAIVDQLNISRKEIKSKLRSFNRAHDCLTGKSQNCESFESVMRMTKYQSPSVTYPNAPELNYAANFHQCIENIKEERYKADLVLDDAAINLALTLTPYAVVSGAKLAGTLARTSKIVSDAAKVERLTGKGALAANIGYGGYHTLDELNRCNAEISAFSKLGKAGRKMSCSNMDKIFVNNSNNSQCVTKAMVSAALLTPVGANSLKLAGKLPKAVPSKISELINKVRRGQSLTKEEEVLLLQRLKKHNPLEKVLNKGLSANDKKFAETMLERLYKKEDVSPEDLLKLSKMIKPMNPPLLVITRQDNVKEIMESQRIWGSTEGSTYAAARPIETKWDKIKTGVHGDKEGTFIFTPEAAVLFKPHEVEGLYSAMKRAAGQYKGPFGDIIIEESKQVMVNGRPHVIITKARRAAGTAKEVRHVQTTGKASQRLWGRRLGIEPVANLSTAASALQMYSWYTDKPIHEIVTEAFQEE
jgi:hypothetical protein